MDLKTFVDMEIDLIHAVLWTRQSYYKLLFRVIFLVTLIVVIISNKYGANLILAIKIIRTNNCVQES